MGLGPGAHSHVGGRRWWNRPDLAGYGGAVLAGEDPREGEEPFDRGREMVDTVLMGLRLVEGLDLGSFRTRFGVALEEAFPGASARLEAAGLAWVSGGRLKLTRRGFEVANRAWMEFLDPAPLP